MTLDIAAQTYILYIKFFFEGESNGSYEFYI